MTPQPPADTDALIERLRMYAATTDPPDDELYEEAADALAREREAREKLDEERKEFREAHREAVRAAVERLARAEHAEKEQVSVGQWALKEKARAERAEAQTEALKNVARLLERRGLFTRHAGSLTDDGEYVELRVPKQLFDEIGDALREALASLLPPQENT